MGGGGTGTRPLWRLAVDGVVSCGAVFHGPFLGDDDGTGALLLHRLVSISLSVCVPSLTIVGRFVIDFFSFFFFFHFFFFFIPPFRRLVLPSSWIYIYPSGRLFPLPTPPTPPPHDAHTDTQILELIESHISYRQTDDC